jgi:hypothetical protein
MASRYRTRQHPSPPTPALPTSACSTPAARRRIPDGSLSAALRSTQNRPRTAVRRGAAWPPAERSSSCLPVQQAVSRVGRWPHRRAVMVAERRVCRRRHSKKVRRHSGVVVTTDAHRALVALSASSVRVRVSSVRPSSVRVRYVSSRRASGVRASGVRYPVFGVWCLVSGVQCPVSSAPCPCPVPVSGVRWERPASVSTLSAPVNSWSAWMRQAATRLGTGRVG